MEVTAGELLFLDASSNLYRINDENIERLPHNKEVEWIAIGKQHEDVFQGPKYENLPILREPQIYLNQPMNIDVEVWVDRKEQAREKALEIVVNEWQRPAHEWRRSFTSPLAGRSHVDLYEGMKRTEENPKKSPYRFTGLLYGYPGIEDGTRVHSKWPVFYLKNYSGYQDVSWNNIANLDSLCIRKVTDPKGMLERFEIKRSDARELIVLKR